MLKKDYIHTTCIALEEADDSTKTLTALKSYLKRRGHSKLLPTILKGISAELAHHANIKKVRVITAREKDYEIFKDEIESLISSSEKKHPYSLEINESIIGGFIIKTQTTKIDRSYKTALLQTYRSLNNKHEYIN